MINTRKPIGIFYEHPAWFKPLFQELERRRIPFIRIHAAQHLFNPSETELPFSLLINRMSSSAFTRGNTQGIFHTSSYLAHVKGLGVPVINGLNAQSIESSKSKQLSLLAELGLPFPKTRIVNHITQVIPAALSLKFPLVVKVNVGGSGSGIIRFNTLTELHKAVNFQQINFGIDQTVLIQEFVPAKDNHIVRVETINGKFLYAVKIFFNDFSFNLCPAELCSTPEINAQNCLDDYPKTKVRVEDYLPPIEIIRAVERIAKAAQIDVGGVEYLIDERDNRPYFYDINALSNFIPDAEQVIGFNPYHTLVDYVEQRLTGQDQPEEVEVAVV
jgi:glutathione synthase/RimK-type ligase-like ATP-grasp enzyme